ncbi:ribonuclease HI [Devosia sp. J2-20]|uniref:ribonuclease H family protein n=1 Tax=Devosia sp. J2-20 TaxID=3026161 RepID=UPI00249B1BDA|nr:ribonuclease H [Devosia sp. J2-20]WDR00863.1 ribonuclease HI [Devosia sp. J2-20]
MTNQEKNVASITRGRHYLLGTDGACKGNPGTGGWGVVIQLKDGDQVLHQRALAGQGEVMISTNNQMELTAPVRGLERLAEPLPAVVLSDSEYVVLGMTGRLEKWKAAGWRNSGGLVKNKELWRQLDQLCQKRAVEWVWQRGHVGHDLNEVADQLASNGASGRYRRGERSVKHRHPDWFW